MPAIPARAAMSCGGEVYQRDDDTERGCASGSTTTTRSPPRSSPTTESKGFLREVDGDRPVDDVWRGRPSDLGSVAAVIVRKSAAEIEIMREAGRISARALRLVGEAVRAGVTHRGARRDRRERHPRRGRHPGVQGLPWLPGDAVHVAQRAGRSRHPVSRRRACRRGHPVGRRGCDRRRLLRRQRGDVRRRRDLATRHALLLDTTAASLDAGIAQCVVGNRLFDIGAAVQTVAEAPGVRRWSASTWGTGSAERCTRTRNVPNYGTAVRGPARGRAWCSRSSRWSTRAATRCDVARRMAGRS